MAKEEEKLDIEDIKDPLEENIKEEQIDIDEVISEEKEEVPKEREVSREDSPKAASVISEDKPLKKSKLKKARKINFKILFLVLGTMFFTAALVLGGVYYYLNYMAEKKTEVQADVTKDVKKIDEVPEEKSVFVSEQSGLRLRKEPNVSAELIATMPYGTRLVVLDEENGWIKVKYEEEIGWCSGQFTVSKNPLLYSNSNYGFELTFPVSWNTFKLFESDAADSAQIIASFKVGIRTSDSGWKETGVDSGYASLFALSIFEKPEWEKIKLEEGPKPALLKEGTRYIYAVEYPNAGPNDTYFMARRDEIKSVLETFLLK